MHFTFGTKLIKRGINKKILKYFHLKGEEHLHKINLPNKETLEALANIEAGKDLVKAKDAEDLFKKLGI
jgi:hypothetical protein